MTNHHQQPSDRGPAAPWGEGPLPGSSQGSRSIPAPEPAVHWNPCTLRPADKAFLPAFVLHASHPPATKTGEKGMEEKSQICTNVLCVVTPIIIFFVEVQLHFSRVISSSDLSNILFGLTEP